MTKSYQYARAGLSGTALALALALPASAQAGVEFGGDFEVNAYTIDDDAGDNDAGVQQLTRVKAHFATEDGVQVNTRFVLTDNQWVGDTHEGDTNSPFSAQDADVVTLDYGYVQVPVAGWLLRVGRQEANWGFGLTTTDDRRDRILAMKKLGSTTVLLGYDKRVEGTINVDADDGDLLHLSAVGVNNGWLWGITSGVFVGDDQASDTVTGGYAARGAVLVGPFAKGKIGNLEVTAAAHYLGNGEVLWTEPTYAGFVRIGTNVGTVKLEGQAMFNLNGSIVAGGFDSFSSLIMNSPDANRSPLSVAGLTLSRFGSNPADLPAVGDALFGEQEDDTVYGLAARATFAVNDKLKLVGALGAYRYDNGGTAGGVTLAGTSADEETVSFVDLQAHYQLYDSTVVWATLGHARAEDYLPATGDITAASVNMLTNF